jgi:predicted peroxiredoxin
MAGRFCVSLTTAKDNCDRATVAFVVANAALGSEKETLVFLSIEGVRLSQKGYADDIKE